MDDPQPDPVETPAFPPAGLELRCQVCGRQDESLRIVAFPYVVSLLVITYRRAFSGLYCLRHRMLYQGLAGLISAAIGWFGIPYGLVYAPAALWKLARGGEMPVVHNQALLRKLAEQKLERGDRTGSVRCLEAALSLGEDQQAADSLRAQASYQRVTFASQPSKSILRFLLMLAGGLGIGIAVGVLDLLGAMLVGLIVGEEGSIYVVLLSWAPLLAFLTVIGLVTFRLLTVTLSGSRVASLPLALGASLVLSSLAIYGLLLGRTFASVAFLVVQGGILVSPLQGILLAGQALTAGGLWTLQDMAQSPDLNGPIYLGILAAGSVYIGLGSSYHARHGVRWQRRIGEAVQGVADWRPMNPVIGWGAMAGMLMLGGLMTALFSLPAEMFSTDPEAYQHSQTAARLMEQGDYRGAIDELDLALELDPENPGLYTDLGLVHLTAGNLQEAGSAFDTAIRLAPDDPNARIGIAVLNVLTGDYIVAEQELTTVLDRNSMLLMPHHLMATVKADGGDLDAAAEHLEIALQIDPLDAETHLRLASIYFGRGQFELAATQMRDLIAIEPNSAEGYAVLSMAQRRLGRESRAEDSLQRAVSLSSEVEDTLLLSTAFEDLHQFERAESYLVQSGTQQIWAGFYSLRLAKLLIAQGELDQAFAAIDAAAALGTDPVMVHNRRAQALVEVGDLSGALQILEQADRISPPRGYVRTSMARVLLFQGEYRAAERQARQALEIAPYDVRAYSILALALLGEGKPEEALTEARQAIRLDPTLDLAQYALGACFESLGEEAEAKSAYERFLELYWERAYVREFRQAAERHAAEH